jgi:raffinose/stachyose/melibiose transport system permease protein
MPQETVASAAADQPSLDPQPAKPVRRSPWRRFWTFSPNIAYNLFLFLLLVLAFYPLVWMAITSVRTNRELYANPWGLPTNLNFETYAKVWETSPIPTYFLNSLIVAVVSTVLILLFSSMAAYAFSRLKFRGSNVLFYSLLAFYFIPPHIALIPLFFVLKALHIQNTIFTLIGPYVAFALPFSTLLIRGFMVSIPGELVDAALIDGCSKFGIFRRIMVPLSTPVLAVVAVFQFVSCWNEYLFALAFIHKRALKTLPVGLMDFVGEFSTDWAAMAAGLTIATIPIIIVYVIFQRQIMQGMTAGALKG